MKQLKASDVKTYYRVQSMVSKLSELKAIDKGQFITRDHLVEYKGLIIWMMKNKANYRGHLNLKSAMTALLNTIMTKKIAYKTTKGIKGIVADLALRTGLNDSDNNLRAAHGLTVLDNTCGNSILEAFQQFKLNALSN